MTLCDKSIVINGISSTKVSHAIIFYDVISHNLHWLAVIHLIIISNHASVRIVQMKPLAKKYHYLANLGEFEGFVDVCPCRSCDASIKLNAGVTIRCSMIILCTEKNLDEKYWFFMTKKYFQNFEKYVWGNFENFWKIQEFYKDFIRKSL